MITLTDSAKSRFKKQLHDRGKGLGIRLDVTKTGCSGYAYKIEFADAENNEDLLSVHDDLNVYISKNAQPLLTGITIDYIHQGLNEKFEFINPNETGRCGCGESFTI